MGRQHQGMDRPGVWQVPEDSGEQGTMEETGCKIICGAPMTPAVRGLMMMMMIPLLHCRYGFVALCNLLRCDKLHQSTDHAWEKPFPLFQADAQCEVLESEHTPH